MTQPAGRPVRRRRKKNIPTPVTHPVRAKDALFWSSTERKPPATDYLEVDLGRARIVNLIEFDIARKPMVVNADYDLLGHPPKRLFSPVEPWNDYPFEPTIVHDSVGLPWIHVLIFFRGKRQSAVTTQFIRLGFTRTVPNPVVGATSGLVNPTTKQPIPFTINVKNLRVGRYSQPDGTPVE